MRSIAQYNLYAPRYQTCTRRATPYSAHMYQCHTSASVLYAPRYLALMYISRIIAPTISPRTGALLLAQYEVCAQHQSAYEAQQCSAPPLGATVIAPPMRK